MQFKTILTTAILFLLTATINTYAYQYNTCGNKKVRWDHERYEMALDSDGNSFPTVRNEDR